MCVLEMMSRASEVEVRGEVNRDEKAGTTPLPSYHKTEGTPDTPISKTTPKKNAA